ncbi:uncharacterized protein BDV17DRAFT_18834 [Aspergillus undulatus]|uniref:uncharacterized protein n=1 Tax=Aspergillus undulatus TaxID=1810928 RepID=UPI003CCE00E8
MQLPRCVLPCLPLGTFSLTQTLGPNRTRSGPDLVAIRCRLLSRYSICAPMTVLGVLAVGLLSTSTWPMALLSIHLVPLVPIPPVPDAPGAGAWCLALAPWVPFRADVAADVPSLTHALSHKGLDRKWSNSPQSPEREGDVVAVVWSNVLPSKL